eukprot:CAMPEP_0184860750 /NCGR_PEP_ID=MMETSP0580-20130426/5572_1 /TAXON_ID=1118495 /ORGANISM="Dactyliosolen fragilissimus" /LENGTH=145 /DNA_ID=CAMNT_0027357965 /DNA_START=748 /DNA_END=1185 /DNA_ORIENTATION=-
MTILDYTESKLCPNNWVTRRLVNKMEKPLTRKDVEKAKNILTNNILVLQLDDMQNSVHRLRKYFGWQDEELNDEQMSCLRRFTFDDPANVNKNKEDIDIGGYDWNSIMKKNKFDLELYNFSRELYKSQGVLFQDFEFSTLRNYTH